MIDCLEDLLLEDLIKTTDQQIKNTHDSIDIILFEIMLLVTRKSWFCLAIHSVSIAQFNITKR